MKKLFAVFGAFFLLFIISTTSSLASDLPVNPVSWKTDNGQFSSGNFYIRIKDKYFFGKEPVNVSMPAGGDHSTIELIWKENGQEMRMFMYFTLQANGKWNMYDLRTFNYEGRDWIYYNTVDKNGLYVEGIPGARNFASERTFVPKDGNVDAEIYCKDCTISTFAKKLVSLSKFGYGIDFNLGSSTSQVITLTPDPKSGYGVNAQLIGSDRVLIKDQTDFRYDWKISNPNIASLTPQSIPLAVGGCAYGINPPCPMMNLQFSGKSAGVAIISLDVVRTSDNQIVASGSFDIKVVDKITNVNTSPSPSPDTKLAAELETLKGQVGRIDKTLEKQAEDISLLRKIVESIQSFLKRIFKFSFK